MPFIFQLQARSARAQNVLLTPLHRPRPRYTLPDRKPRGTETTQRTTPKTQNISTRDQALFPLHRGTPDQAAKYVRYRSALVVKTLSANSSDDGTHALHGLDQSLYIQRCDLELRVAHEALMLWKDLREMALLTRMPARRTAEKERWTGLRYLMTSSLV